MTKKREIRNSTAEFLIFQAENKEQGIEVMYADETIWCTQKAMAALFDVGVPAISKHLANVFETGELNEEATISNFEIYMRNYMVILRFAQTQAERVLCFIFNI